MAGRTATGARRASIGAGLFTLAVFAFGAASAQSEAPARPNIVVILADDVGFTDLSAYGGEAKTANIDALARSGRMFTRYHTSPLCAPSRAMLLTGLDNHLTGVATIPEVLTEDQRGQPGYTMHLEPGVETIAARLKRAGYRTYMTGKWHLGRGDGDLPDSHGFDRSFALDASGADNWAQKPYMPYYTEAPWFEDGEPATLPEDFYSSEFIVDKMMEYLASAEDQDTPFFAYVSFQAIHIPVQAPREFTANYDGVYDAGWEALRDKRWRRAKSLGLIDDGAPAPQPVQGLRDWNDLSTEDRALWAKSMAVNAGMLEAMDHHVGRLIARLKETGDFENTIFVVTSDNGPAPSDPLAARGFETWMRLHGYDRRLDNLGEEGSFVYIGPEWANAAASPGAFFKFYAAEGGTRVPLIVSGPGVAPGEEDGLAFVADLAPTLLDAAGVAPQADGARAMTGRSLGALLRGGTEAVYGPDEPVGLEVSGSAALFRGDYKLTRNPPPAGDGTWRLFDVVADPGETIDLSEAEPRLFARMAADYDAYAERVGVLPTPEGYTMPGQLHKNVMAKQKAHYLRLGVFILIGIAVVFAGLFFALRRRRA